jgi:hypothetical protein
LSYTFIFRKQFYFVISGLKIIGHGNPDNNLESPCILEEAMVSTWQWQSNPNTQRFLGIISYIRKVMWNHNTCRRETRSIFDGKGMHEETWGYETGQSRSHPRWATNLLLTLGSRSIHKATCFWRYAVDLEVLIQEMCVSFNAKITPPQAINFLFSHLVLISGVGCWAVLQWLSSKYPRSSSASCGFLPWSCLV